MAADQTITCQDCGAEFTFSADEQDFYASKGFDAPKRCPECRAARKAARGEGGGGRGGGPRELFPAVCAECGKDTEVPFQPRGDRPVYCRDCFSRRAASRY